MGQEQKGCQQVSLQDATIEICQTTGARLD